MNLEPHLNDQNNGKIPLSENGGPWTYTIRWW